MLKKRSKAVDKPDNVRAQYLRFLCDKGWRWRKIPKRSLRMARRRGVSRADMIKVYKDRLEMELAAFERQKFVDYVLIVYDLYRWARIEGIWVGPGRGSAAGSLTLYLIGVTAIDPIEHNLMFERFINPNRIDMPDVDMDFEDDRREEVFEYLRDKYGDDNTAMISTVGRMKGKLCLRDIARVLEIDQSEITPVTSSIVERSSGDERASQTIEDGFKEFKVCREFDARHPEVLPLAMKLEGHARQVGVHAAGMVLSPVSIKSVVPIETVTRGDRRVSVTGVDMWGAQSQGLLKFDILGLRTMTILRRAADAVNVSHPGAGIDLEFMERLPLDDPKVLQGFTDHDYVGIFQYDSTGAHAACEGLTFENFDDVAALTALNRPGCMRSGLATQYSDRKKDPKKIKPVHPIVDPITADTLGVLVYQEQVNRIFIEVAGYQPATADSLRKAIAKKWGDETIGKERETFIKGAKERGVPDKVAKKLIDAITFFGSYGFNKSHACAYGAISYWGMWFKTYYPTQLYLAIMICEPDRSELQRIIKDAKKHGIEVLPPHVNISGLTFQMDGDSIRCSLVDIKGVGVKAVESIVENQPYASFVDLLQRVNRRCVHKGVLVALAKAGALDELVPNRKEFIENAADILDFAGKKKWGDLEAALEAIGGKSDYSDEDAQIVASDVLPLYTGAHPIEIYSELFDGLFEQDWIDPAGDPFEKETNNAWIRGIIVDIKYNCVGDFHSGALPPEEERKKMNWGARYANINVEDASGENVRVKVDWDIFDDFRHIVDKGKGVSVAIHASIAPRWRSIRAHYMVDLNETRRKAMNGEPLSVFERCFTKDHPVKDYTRKSLMRASRLKECMPIGMVTHRKIKVDKNGNEMAFFGLQGRDHTLECVCFASNWRRSVNKQQLTPGNIIRVALVHDRGGSYVVDGRYEARTIATVEEIS